MQQKQRKLTKFRNENMAESGRKSRHSKEALLLCIFYMSCCYLIIN